MKQLLTTAIALLLFTATACNNKNLEPEPDPDEYFSFYADGEYFNYPQKAYPFTNESKALEAMKVGTTEYRITAWDDNAPGHARGIISMFFSGAQIPDKDTVTLTSARITSFKSLINDYTLKTPLFGRVVFSERNSGRLTGTFEFQAYKYDAFTGDIHRDTIISIANGKFSIIPSK